MKFTSLAPRIVQHLMAVGDPKSGKSTLVSQLAELGFKLLWISIDNGHQVLSKLSQKGQENIDIIVLPDTKDFPVAVTTCLKLLTGKECNICNSHGQVDCSMCKKDNRSFSRYSLNELAHDPENTWIVVIDPISQLADSAMNFVCKGEKDDFKAGYDEYRTWMNIMVKMLSNIQQAPYNICCIAHLVETEMEDGKKKLVPMVGSGPFSRKVGGYFDHIVYCDINNMKHNFGSATTYKGTALTGSRSDIKIEDMKDKPSLLPFFNGIIKKAKDIEVAEDLVGLKVLAEDKEALVPVEEKIDTSIPGAGVVTEMHSVASTSSQTTSALDALAKLRQGKKQ